LLLLLVFPICSEELFREPPLEDEGLDWFEVFGVSF
jgi:hypothetical protein